jgi:hypothetical protein
MRYLRARDREREGDKPGCETPRHADMMPTPMYWRTSPQSCTPRMAARRGLRARRWAMRCRGGRVSRSSRQEHDGGGTWHRPAR